MQIFIPNEPRYVYLPRECGWVMNFSEEEEGQRVSQPSSKALEYNAALLYISQKHPESFLPSSSVHIPQVHAIRQYNVWVSDYLPVTSFRLLFDVGQKVRGYIVSGRDVEVY